MKTPKAFTKHPVARQEHRCSECSDVIKKGDKYTRLGVVYGHGGSGQFKVCNVCSRFIAQAEDLGLLIDNTNYGDRLKDIIDGAEGSTDREVLHLRAATTLWLIS